MPPQVVVFVPGIMGSVLKTREGTQVWPGAALELVLRYSQFDDLMKEDLVVDGIIRKVLFVDVYDSLVAYLGRCKFREKATPPTLYCFAYDWRKDIRRAGQGLAELLERVRAEHGAEVEITLIGHSMGGLVSRYFLESGRFSNNSAWANVRRLITIGTPHRGTPVALTAAMGKERRLFLSGDQVHLLCSDERYPSLYQLLPPPGEPFLWDETNQLMPIDVYSDSVSRSLNLKPLPLAAARELHLELNIAKRPEHVRYFFFAGTRQRTLSAIKLSSKGVAGEYVSEFRRIESDDGGDGTVPTWSSMMTSMQTQPVSGEHSVLFRSHELRVSLSSILGVAGTLAGEVPLMELSLRDRVVMPEDPLHLSITMIRPRNEVRGVVRVEPMDHSFPPRDHPLEYSGLAAETLSLTISAPAVPGIYRVSFRDGDTELAGDELFVQADEPPH